MNVDVASQDGQRTTQFLVCQEEKNTASDDAVPPLSRGKNRASASGKSNAKIEIETQVCVDEQREN